MFIINNKFNIISILIFLYIFNVNGQDNTKLTKGDIDNYFLNYPFGVKSNNGQYVKYSPISANGTIIGFSSSGSSDFSPNSDLNGSFYLPNITDIVKDHLGPDGRPEYAHGNNPFIVTDPSTGKNYTLVHNSSTFYEWFHNVPCVNYPVNGSLYLASKPQEFVFLPQNYSYPFGTLQDPLPYFYYPTFQFSIYGKARKGVDTHISIITNWECFFFINNTKQLGVFLEGPGNEDIYYYDYNEPLAENTTIKIDIFCASRYSGVNGVIDISLYNSFSDFSCVKDSCDVCGHNDTCGCNKGPIVGCSRADKKCYNCQYVNDCGYLKNDNPLCQNRKCINNSSCIIEPINCDDNDPCTVDECFSLYGCTHTLCPNPLNNQCLNNGTCLNGKCIYNNICEKPTPRLSTPCQSLQCSGNQICVEDFSNNLESLDQIFGVAKCIDKKKHCINCEDLGCSSQGLSCKYIQIEKDENCNGKCEIKNECCNYQATCY